MRHQAAGLRPDRSPGDLPDLAATHRRILPPAPEVAHDANAAACAAESLGHGWGPAAVPAEPASQSPAMPNERPGDKPLQRSRMFKEHIVLAVYKPKYVLSRTGKDASGRRTLTDVLVSNGAPLLKTHIGRLDYYTSGLILMSTDTALHQCVINRKIAITFGGSPVTKTYRTSCLPPLRLPRPRV